MGKFSVQYINIWIHYIYKNFFVQRKRCFLSLHRARCKKQFLMQTAPSTLSSGVRALLPAALAAWPACALYRTRDIYVWCVCTKPSGMCERGGIMFMGVSKIRIGESSLALKDAEEVQEAGARGGLETAGHVWGAAGVGDDGRVVFVFVLLLGVVEPFFLLGVPAVSRRGLVLRRGRG